MRCGFCFATFEDTRSQLPKGHLPEPEALAVIDAIAAAGGVEKLTFVGGEPTLCAWLPNLIARAKSHGLITMVVTNGWRLRQDPTLIEGCEWLALSVDSLDSSVNLRSGRALPNHAPLQADELLAIVEQARERGIRIKLNTVVHALNHHEDMTEFVVAMRPERWKLFQVLPIHGQNDARFGEFAVAEADFLAFVARHTAVAERGIAVVPENNHAMQGTYGMIDPRGCFIDNADGVLRYSPRILDVGVEAAWQQIRFDTERFVARGGHYDYGQPLVTLQKRSSTP
jgi:radical S-adenosyl methionine domain-containing protein 2